MIIEEAFQSAVEYYQAGNFKQAEHICKEILKFQPDHFDALHLIGMLYLQLKKYDLAISNIEKALQLNPEAPFIYYNLGTAYRENGQVEQAIACYEQSLQLDQTLEAAYYNLGIIFQEKEQADDAIEAYRKALELNPNAADVYNNLGLVYQGKGHLDEAIKCYYKALHINPDSDLAHSNLGAAVLQQADTEFIKKKGRLSDGIGCHTTHLQGTILIAVPVFNRKRITRLSLGQTKRYKTANCHLQVYNDHSTEFDNLFLEPYADEVIQLPDKMGVHNLRWYQFRAFLESDFDFLYMTDNDVIHDPAYITVLEVLYGMGNRKLPVCLFNSEFHKHTTLYSENGILLRLTAPGVSMFYDRKMVEKIVENFDKEEYTYLYNMWDFRAVALLGLPWVMPELSYLEHYGTQGINNRDFERDRAINPSPYLQERRELILKYLTNNDDVQIVF